MITGFYPFEHDEDCVRINLKDTFCTFPLLRDSRRGHFLVLLLRRRNESFRFGGPGRQDHLLEHPDGHLQQVVWRAKLDRFARVHHQHPVRVHDGVQTVGDRQDGALGKLDADRLLDQAVGAESKI